MTKQGDKPVTEIGSFKRPKGEQNIHEDLLVPPDAGKEAIDAFIHGRPQVDPNKTVEPETRVTPKESPNPATPPSSTKEREAALIKAMREIEDSPELTYDQKIEKHGLTKEQAMEIVDAMFTQGFYEKTVPVAGNVTITFRTRKTEDQDRLFQRLESEGPQYPATVSNFVSKYNLAASMRQYKGQQFGDDVEFKNKYNYVCNLPDTIFRLLCVKLAKFDEMILDVLDEGAIANF
jgi:hypothetical protein